MMQHAGGRGCPNELKVERIPDVGYPGPGPGLLSSGIAVVIFLQLLAAAIMHTLISKMRLLTTAHIRK